MCVRAYERYARVFPDVIRSVPEFQVQPHGGEIVSHIVSSSRYKSANQRFVRLSVDRSQFCTAFVHFTVLMVHTCRNVHQLHTLPVDVACISHENMFSREADFGSI